MTNISIKSSVVVVVFQIVLYIIATSAERGSSLSPTSASNPIRTSNEISNTNVGMHKNTAVPMEGGGDISSQDRENQLKGPILPTSNVTIEHSSAAATSVSKGMNSSSTKSSTSTTTTTTERNIPISEKPVVSTASDHRKIAARKGVNFTEFANAQKTVNATTPKPKPKKPTLTVASDEEPFAPSHFQSITKSNSSAAPVVPNVPLDIYSESSQGKTQQYVLPIVLVILSVPFVAILISFVYKRGAEWWKYRHYRRMDFLINGMYDN